ncbi:MAG: DUF3570 domain-containing protein [Candidatus Polarisedimenticolaceae bacterium]|nr:DUF3570 domain-containing protein [Candidatus Polarisedimenticolaceae bacterium]
MQLKNRRLRQQLSLATCALLTSIPGQASADWEVDTGILAYSETDRVRAVKSIITAKRITDETTTSVTLLVDTLTGASPNGATAATTAQTFTTASGNSYTTAANERPLRDFRDTRSAISASWEKVLNRLFRLKLGADVSTEDDYDSVGLNVNLSRDFNQRLTTLTIGAAVTQDTITPSGGTPVEGSATDGATISTQSSEESKQTTDLLLGVTQVLSRTTLTQLNYSYSLANGYMSDPYKIVSEVDAVTGDTTGYQYEKRPDQRIRQSINWTTAHHLTEDVIHFSYRYFWDDWGIDSHTFDLKYRYELGAGHYLQPQVRYYMQSAADFYRHSLVDSETLPRYVSSDQRLGEMSSYTIGLKYGFPLFTDGNLSLRLAYMQQSGDSSPSDAIGSQKQVDLFPTLEAVIINVNFNLPF